jgi:paraquat-inducible protein B
MRLRGGRMAEEGTPAEQPDHRSGPPPGPDDSADERAHQRPHRWFVWVWVVPIVAAAIVLWLAFQALADRGPSITISFKVADGLQAGQTRVQHRNVDLGMVESLELTPDMSRVIVHARMSKAATNYLNEHTRFAIITPRVGFNGITGLSTLVSGSYIEMYPGPAGGGSQRDFMGLDEPPILPPDTHGRSFVLDASDLGSLTRGSPISYHGMTVGEVLDYRLTDDQQGLRITAFVRNPFDQLVHPETRFWNAGGVDLTVGTQGLRVRANSWQQLLAGGIAFETPQEVLAQPPSPDNAQFHIFDNNRKAVHAPLGDELYYVAEFTGNQRGLGGGTSVELQGNEVGEVSEAHLRYDPQQHTLVTRIIFSIDPKRVQILGMVKARGTTQQDAVRNWISSLVRDGLRAQVSTVSFLTGLKIITLDVDKGAPAARVEKDDDFDRIPAGGSADFTEILQSLHSVLKNIDHATAGPELGHALKSLDETLTRLDKMTQEVEPDIKQLVTSLHDTADSAQKTLDTIQGLIGNSAPAGTDLPRLMHELTEAARAVRGLADYLDRHPEALIRGRKGEAP